MNYTGKDAQRIASQRFKEFKEASGMTYEELAEKLGYENPQHMWAFASNKRKLSKKAAKKLHDLTGWRVEYWMGLDNFKTEEDFLRYELPLAKEMAYAEAWNAFTHEIEEYGGFNLVFVHEGEYRELVCKYNGVSIPFKTLRHDLLEYAKLYINQWIDREKANNQQKEGERRESSET